MVGLAPEDFREDMQESIPDQDVGAIGKKIIADPEVIDDSIEVIDDASEAAVKTCSLMKNSLFRMGPSKGCRDHSACDDHARSLSDECAVFGIYGTAEAAVMTLGLCAQHRGEKPPALPAWTKMDLTRIVASAMSAKTLTPMLVTLIC